MECRVKPYNGNEARAAMIHASDDDAIVFPFIERLNKSGLRIWHDSDARKIKVDYPRNWKKQQALSSAYIVFLTQNAVNNHVFRERLTNAVESRKPVVVIITLKQEILSPGMKLQLEKAAEVIQSSDIPGEGFDEEIVSLKILKEYVGEPKPEMEVSAYPPEHAKKEAKVPPRWERDIAPSERTMLELEGKLEPAAPIQAEKPKTEIHVSSAPKGLKTSDSSPDQNASLEETIRISDVILPDPANSEETYVPRKTELPVVVSLVSGEKKKGMLGESVVGRVKKIQGSVADISFTDDCRMFSGRHFSLFYIDNICKLVCRHPNGMNVNGQDLQEGDQFTIESEAIIQIPSNATLAQLEKNEMHPSWLAVATGIRAKELWEAETIAYLKSNETGEIRYFTDHFAFGRGNAWKTGVMTSRSISRNHGEVVFESGQYYFKDHSANGTMINEAKINNSSLELKDGDIITVQGYDQKEESFTFHNCSFRKG